jgi:hypothetical protein
MLRVRVSGLGPAELERVLCTNARTLFLGSQSRDREEVTAPGAVG